MTNNEHELQAFGDPEETKFLLLMQGIDNARGHMFKASERYRSLPTNRYFNTFTSTVILTGTAVAETVAHIVTRDPEDSSIEKGQLITQILTEDDEKRITHFNQLFEEVEFFPAKLADEGLVTKIATALDELGPDLDIATGVMSEYMDCVQTDIDKFTEAVQETKNAQLLEIASKVGKEALTMAKFTAIGAASIYLGTRHLRKK